jgi:hypothetical protein
LLSYFLGVLIAAYREFELRAEAVSAAAVRRRSS